MNEELIRKIQFRWEKKNKRSLFEHIRFDSTDTLDAYIYKLEKQWADVLNNRLRIYLDQRFWIDFQRTVAGRPTHKDSQLIYSKLMDSSPKVWQRVGMVEHSHAATMLFDTGMKLLVDLKSLEQEKFLLEIMSEMTLEEFTSSVSALGSMVTNMEKEIKNETARIKQEDSKENYANFGALHKFELAGMLKAVITGVYPEHFASMDCTKISNIDKILQDEDAIRTIIPMAYAFSGLQALLRNDPSRKINKNDYFDTQHSSFGIAFCEVLFTERSFSHLLQQGPLFLADFYGTKVLSKYQDIVQYVIDLSS
jgi:hypothetical protein